MMMTKEEIRTLTDQQIYDIVVETKKWLVFSSYQIEFI